MATRTHNRRAMAFCLSLVIGPSIALAQGPEDIVWQDEARSQAALIPESVFARLDWSDPQTVDFSGLGMSSEQQSMLRAMVLEKINSTAPFECDPPAVSRATAMPTGGPLLSSLADQIRAENVNAALVGEIVRRAPVWNPGFPYPLTRVFVRVEEILKAPERTKIRKGDEISYQEFFGDIRIGPARFCMEPPEDWRTRPAFSNALVLGLSYSASPLHLWATRVFRIESGQIFPEHEPSPSGLLWPSLDELRAELRAPARGRRTEED